MKNATTLPGDWTVRGTVIVDRSEAHLPNAGRVETLRTVAGMVRDGLTVTSYAVDGIWTRIVAERRGQSRAECRKAARAAMVAS